MTRLIKWSYSSNTTKGTVGGGHVARRGNTKNIYEIILE
jgi:hypothetical protein